MRRISSRVQPRAPRFIPARSVRRDDDAVDRLDAGARGVRVARVLAVDAGRRRAGFARSPAPDGQRVRAVAVRFVRAVVAAALTGEIVANQIAPRNFVLARRADGLPAGERPGAVERDVVELVVRALLANEDEVRLRIRGIGEEDVARQVLAGRDDVDELRVAGVSERGAAGHVRRDVERVLVVLALHDEGAARAHLEALAFANRRLRAGRRRVPRELRAVDRAGDARRRRLVLAVDAIAITAVDVLASERANRRDLLVRAVARARVDVDALLLAPDADRMIGADDAAEQVFALLDAEHLALRERIGDRRLRGSPRDAGAGRDRDRRLDRHVGVVRRSDDRDRRIERVVAEGSWRDGDVVRVPRRGREEQRRVGDLAA